MPLPTNRTTSSTPAEHVADHNALHAEYNTPTHTHSGTTVGTLGYAQVTATQGSITTEADLTSLTATVTVAAGRRIKITGVVLVQTTNTDTIAYLRIKESTTVLQIASQMFHLSTDVLALRATSVLTPSAGSHTYKLSLARQGGTGTLSMVAGATFPAFILVEDIGT
jgi:hypothetical protein